RFQIHLSTAIVMMFVAGGLIWANIGEQLQYLPKEWGIFHGRSFGWPATGFIPELKRAGHDGNWSALYVVRYQTRPYLIALDLVIIPIILLSAYLFSEWLIRRRAARKGA